MELLEQFSVACDFLLKSGVAIPNAEIFTSLLSKAMALLNEIQAEKPKTLIYQKISDEKKHQDKSNGEVTEPCFIRLLYWVVGSWILRAM